MADFLIKPKPKILCNVNSHSINTSKITFFPSTVANAKTVTEKWENGEGGKAAKSLILTHIALHTENFLHVLSAAWGELVWVVWCWCNKNEWGKILIKLRKSSRDLIRFPSKFCFPAGDFLRVWSYHLALHLWSLRHSNYFSYRVSSEVFYYRQWFCLIRGFEISLISAKNIKKFCW